MSTTKNIDERINEAAQNDALSIDFPRQPHHLAESLGLPRDEVTDDLYRQYLAAFKAASRG